MDIQQRKLAVRKQKIFDVLDEAGLLDNVLLAHGLQRKADILWLEKLRDISHEEQNQELFDEFDREWLKDLINEEKQNDNVGKRTA